MSEDDASDPNQELVNKATRIRAISSQITIPLPFPSTIRRGWNSLATGKNNLNIRMGEYDKPRIKSAADILGMSMSDFTRFCILAVAEQIHNLDAKTAAGDKEHGTDTGQTDKSE